MCQWITLSCWLFWIIIWRTAIHTFSLSPLSFRWFSCGHYALKSITNVMKFQLCANQKTSSKEEKKKKTTENIIKRKTVHDVHCAHKMSIFGQRANCPQNATKTSAQNGKTHSIGRMTVIFYGYLCVMFCAQSLIRRRMRTIALLCFVTYEWLRSLTELVCRFCFIQECFSRKQWNSSGPPQIPYTETEK